MVKNNQNFVLKKRFFLLKYQKLLTCLVKNPKNKFHVLLSAFIWNHPMVEYFSKTSQEHTPIEEDTSAPWMDVQIKLNMEHCTHPMIFEHEIYQNMRQAKKTDIPVPGDIPATMLKNFYHYLPALSQQFQHTHGRKSTKRNTTFLLKKKPVPESENDISRIGLTHFVSK